MRIISILQFLFFSTATLFSQVDTLSNHNRKKFQLNPWDNINGIKIAPSFYKNFELEVAYFISSYPELDPGYGGFFQLVQNVGLGVEYINSGNQNAIGGKITYE